MRRRGERGGAFFFSLSNDHRSPKEQQVGLGYVLFRRPTRSVRRAPCSGLRFAARGILTTTQKSIQVYLNEFVLVNTRTCTVKSAPVVGGIECGIKTRFLIFFFSCASMWGAVGKGYNFLAFTGQETI